MSRIFCNDLSAQDLRESLSYDYSTGVFVWSASLGGVRKGSVAGCNLASGYRVISVKGGRYLAHRLAWLYVYGEWPSDLIDHIDGDVQNNAIANLRQASAVENGQNRPTTLGYHRSRSGKYRAQITINKTRVYLGHFESEEAARAAYVAASRKHFGEFSGVSGEVK